jgi:hypothetical protein
MGFNYMESATLTKKRDTFVLNERVPLVFMEELRSQGRDLCRAQINHNADIVPRAPNVLCSQGRKDDEHPRNPAFA